MHAILCLLSILCVRADDDEAATAARLERACHEAGKVGTGMGRTGLCTTVGSPLWDTLRAGWPSDEPLVVADVGANKGFFCAIALARFSPACGVDSPKVQTRVAAYFAAAGVSAKPGGPCGGGKGWRHSSLPATHLADEAAAAARSRCGGESRSSRVVVHAFEPSPPLYEMGTRLQKDYFSNTREAWHWHRLAVSNYEGVAEFSAVWHEGSSLKKRVSDAEAVTANVSAFDRNDATRVVPVHVTTLDRWAERHRVSRLGIVKVDAEGHDLNVIEGAQGLLKERRVDVLIWEALHGWPFGTGRIVFDGTLVDGPAALFEALARVEMTCYVLGNKANILVTNVTATQWRVDHRAPAKCLRGNFACVKDGTALADLFRARSVPV
jgi:FkbM family methyltransferase